MCFQGSSNHTGLLHPGLAAGLIPDEAPEADAHLHLQPTQGVPGGAAELSHGERHQAQGAAAHLPGLATQPSIWHCATPTQPQVNIGQELPQQNHC